jgi:serine/threonine protein kinase/tetratricopeptide (TPR) repeat protein
MIDIPVADDEADNNPPGSGRAGADWLTGAATPPPAGNQSNDSTGKVLPSRIAHYAIERKIGEGGMGIVYAARDERLQRTVALKTMSSLSGDEVARKRFWREARTLASVNHPNICQIYEIGEHAGELFIAMELLEGEVLGDRLRRGPMNTAEALPITLGMLAALSVLHSRGIVHRDLKPSNVFLTSHGVKLLDFGLARPEIDPSISLAGMTRTGIVVGTPRYMAPEQATGEAVDARTDVFATGAILFEMLAGRPAFSGRTVIEVLHATRYEQPPALTGSPAVAAVDRVIRRALAKRPDERLQSAETMAEELRTVRGTEADETLILAHALTRLVVLPFRVLRPDPETDFLAYSLPDAIATSLSRVTSLVLRSTAVAARFAQDAPDLKALATDADVDRVVMGTLLRAGDQLRAAVQLVEAPSGTLIASHTVQSSLGDLFRLQDDIARRVVDALALPLAGTTPTPTPDVPHDARAYQLYLRGNELARNYDGMVDARELYQQCLELDPRFAPAWARIGRCHRVIGKYIDSAPDSDMRAEEAFRRALALSPRLTIAHKYYANLEADIGQSQRAMVRLLGEADRHGNDPELFAGLVHACRYCGLYEQSIAAHAEARRLDPNVPTSFEQTILMTGDIDHLLAVLPPPVVIGADDGIRVIGLGLAGRRDEARQRLQAMSQPLRIPAFQSWVGYLMAWLDGRASDMRRGVGALSALKIQDDPEAIFQEGRLLCDVGEYAEGLPLLRRAVDKGYSVATTLSTAPQFDAIRGNPEFVAILAAAEAGRDRALAAFRGAGGERLLGS